MNRESLKKIINKLIEFTYLSIVFLIPLYFAVVPKTTNVFELNKSVLFRILVLLLLLFCFLYFILFKDFRIKTFLFFKKNGRFFLIPSLFVLVYALATFFSDFPKISFWGVYERQAGLYNYLFYLLFLIQFVLLVNTKEKLINIIKCISFTAFVVCVYGLVQIFGLDPLHWNESSQFRIISTIGQPNFLASYLVLVIPISIFLFFENKKIISKLFFGLNILMQFTCLCFTYSRGGQLSILLSSVLFIFIYFFSKRGKKMLKMIKLKHYLLFLLIIISFLSLFWINLSSYQKLRIKYIFDTKQGSVAARMDYWQASWSAFKVKPFLGYGPENQREVFVKYYTKEWGVYNDVNTVPVRAHNIIFDTMITGGILGLISLLIFISYFIKIGLDNISSGKFAKLSIAILFGSVSYLFSLFFSFSITITEVYFWMFLGILIVIKLLGNEQKDEIVKGEGDKLNLINIFIKYFIAIFIIIIIFFQVTKEGNKVLADVYFRAIQNSLNKNEIFESYLLYDYLQETGNINDYYDESYGSLLADRYEKFSDKAMIVSGKKKLEIIFGNLSDNNFRSRLTRAKIYSVLAHGNKNEYYDLAEKEFDILISDIPNLPLLYYEYAKHCYRFDDYEKAEKIILDTIDKLPNINEFKIDEKHKKAIEHSSFLYLVFLGDVYLSQNKLDYALVSYEKSKLLNLEDRLLYKKIADVYYLLGDIDGAIMTLEDAYSFYPEEYYWPYTISLLYFEKGEINNSFSFADKAFNLNPDDEKIKALIANIKKKE